MGLHLSNTALLCRFLMFRPNLPKNCLRRRLCPTTLHCLQVPSEWGSALILPSRKRQQRCSVCWVFPWSSYFVDAHNYALQPWLRSSSLTELPERAFSYMFSGLTRILSGSISTVCSFSTAFGPFFSSDCQVSCASRARLSKLCTVLHQVTSK